MSGAGERLDILVQKYKAGNISESIARSASASIIHEMNKKKIKRERNTGRDPKLFTFESMFVLEAPMPFRKGAGSETVTRRPIQDGEGGSIPTPALIGNKE